jgi:extracellular factor (EF) 3-hydroxypalmitic acid methyl ester biosynthesis protein
MGTRLAVDANMLHGQNPSTPTTIGNGVLPPLASSTRRYEDLDGGQGMEIHFRPPRYRASELEPLAAVVSVETGAAGHAVKLHDVSQNGVAFEWSGVPRFEVGDTLPLLGLTFDRHAVYRGAARIGSVRQADGAHILGASFLDGPIDIDGIFKLRNVKAWRSGGPGFVLKERPWCLAGQEEFKSRIADFRLLLQDAERQIGELEASLPSDVVHGQTDLPARSALMGRVRSEFVQELLSMYMAIGSLGPARTPADHHAMKEYSLRQLHEYLVQSPWLRRAKEKPLGYPGDYELMNGIYGSGAYAGFSGPTLFAKAINVLVTDAPSSVAVVERKNLIRRRLSALLDARRPTGRPIRVLSLAAGPAQETYELLAARESIPHPVEIVLFDQDKQALAFAHRRLEPLVATKWPKQVKIVYLHDTIKRLLRDPRLFSSLGAFDMIFSCGLFDYLPRATAVTLTTNLYANLAPEGCLYIGNQMPATSSRWVMEFHCDWYLIFREHAEMLDFAMAGAPSARVAIVEEPTGINPFVTLTREPGTGRPEERLESST